jgi:hypothetical protein
MTADELDLAKISEDFLTRTFAAAQADERLGAIIQEAVDSANSVDVDVADTEGAKLEEICDRLGLNQNEPILSNVDQPTRIHVAPILIRIAEAFAGALIHAQVKPEDLAKMVTKRERTSDNSDSFAAHGNANLAKLFSPT